MRVLLASLAACDVDVVTTHATLLGLEIETLSVEVDGARIVTAANAVEYLTSGASSLSF
jgi:uncharacterized OsmC-like protein